MTDLLATLIRFQRFVFEYGPFFLAAWFVVASVTGLIAVARDRLVNFKTSRWQLLLSVLWRPEGKIPRSSIVSGGLLFSLAASVPSLVITGLVGLNLVWMRLILAAPFALLVSRSVRFLALPKLVTTQNRKQKTEPGISSLVSDTGNSVMQLKGLPLLARVTWKSFTGQANSAILPLLIGFALASALIVYLPVYAIRPWLGDGAWWAPYLAALLVIPFQLNGGAEVPLAAALLIKGGSLGTALSVMLVTPITASYLLGHFYQPTRVKATVVHLVASWLAAGSLGTAVDGVQRLLG